MSAVDDPLIPARARMHRLRARLEATTGQPVRLVETHISWLLLTPTLACKLKQPLRLPFLDFSALEARRRCCDEELRLGQRLAPGLYQDVVEVREGRAGPRFADDAEADGPVVDVAVRMRRFPDGALWSEMLAAGTLAPAHIDAMAQRLARFHAAADVAPATSAYGSAAVRARITQGLIAAFDAAPGLFADWPTLRRWLARSQQALAPLWAARRRAGRVREGHGDLHLANLLQLDGEPAAFDAIEFDAALRWIDVLDDIAFLVMDLMAHGRSDLAFRFLNAYLDHGGDHDGLPAWRYLLVCRALVRAQVGTLSAPAGAEAGLVARGPDYPALAQGLARGASPRLAITHGLPGSGKTWVSQTLLEAAGAVRVRSDVERKRLFGLAALEATPERLAATVYGTPATARTYARLLEVARTALEAGWPVIVDAAFLRQDERASFARLAAALGVPFTILDCRADLALLHARIAARAARGGDASEADGAVLERLHAVAEPLRAEEDAAAIVIDATGPLAAGELARRWMAAGS